MGKREDILDDFTAEQEISPATLKTYLQLYPQHAEDLLAIFNELEMLKLEAGDHPSS